MTKTKSQLRAEAVERLRGLNCMDVDCYQLLEATVDDAGEKVGYRVEISKLIDLLTDDAHESRGSYEERLYDVPVSDCPYCGCERVVIHDFSDIYEDPHSYRVEHVDEKEAFETGCFETYYAFDSVEKAVEHANMHTLSIDDGTPSNTDGTCPDADGTASIDQGDGVAKLDAQARAEIEDAERSRAVSGDSGQGADVDSIEGGRSAQDTRECSDDEIVYGFQFCDKPDSTMLGETMFDYSGEPVGWIVANGLKGDCGHDADISDSREGLEEDVRGYYDEHECDTLMRVDFLDAVYAWLDRQAAITRAECDKPNWDYCETCEQLKAMQDKIDELEAALKGERNNFYQAMESRKHWQREYENLKVASETYRDGMHAQARRVGEVKAERDRYREKLGRALDAAHEIARMVDES